MSPLGPGNPAEPCAPKHLKAMEVDFDPENCLSLPFFNGFNNSLSTNAQSLVDGWGKTGEPKTHLQLSLKLLESVLFLKLLEGVQR